MADANANAMDLGWDIEDGNGGTVLYSWNGASTSTQAIDIDGTLTAFGSWTYANAPTVQLTFTDPSVYLRKNSSSTQAHISAIWVEAAGGPTTTYHNPFSSRTFNNQYERRIR